MDLTNHINKKYGDFLVLNVVKIGNNWQTSKFKVKCLVCGAILVRCGQILYKNPRHNRLCYQGLYNNIPWKDQYSKRYANILRRCKTSKYYKNIKCELKFYEFMDEMLRLQKENNLSDIDMQNLTIDRIDNSKGYKKGNLRLVTMLTQVYNRRVKVNCFIASKNNEIILCNSSKMFADFIECSVGNINNAVKGYERKKAKGWKITKISEDKFYEIKNNKCYTKIFHKTYL